MADTVGAGDVIVTSEPEAVLAADRVVLPGDGAFAACKAALGDIEGLGAAIEEAVLQRGRPFLGICIGMQMMATIGREHGDTHGFDWIKGEVVPIRPNDPSLKVPHMGWNDLVITGRHPVLEGVTTGDHAYFVHSYHMQVVRTEDRLAHADYGGDVTAIVGTGTMVGTQFHPEKSQSAGLRLIANFLRWAP